jgi:hypothetical protein
VQDVEILIDRLLSRLPRRRLDPFIRLGKTISRHRDGILDAIRLGINQGRTEALNNKARLITRTRLRLPQRQGRARARATHLRADHPSPPTPTTRRENRMTLTTSMPREPEIGPELQRKIRD